MKAIAWLFRLAFFLLVLWFALKNTAPVTVRLTESIAWVDVPLIVVILVSLLVGALGALLAMAPRLWARSAVAAKAMAARPQTLGFGRPTAANDIAADRMADAARNVGAVGQLDGDTRAR
jgi:uncharacterized integral membrane protein